MNIKQMKSDVAIFASKTYQRWRVREEKAPKDIVGEEFERMRRGFWQSYGLQAQHEVIAGYNADTVVRRGETVLVIEEDKGHYYDACMLRRFLFNTAEIILHYVEEGKVDQVPVLSLCSSTKMKGCDDIFSKSIKVFDPTIQRIMKEKIRFFSYCKHDRIKAKRYYATPQGGYVLDDDLLQEQLDFAKEVIG